jgi:hypothetical protein
MPQTPVVEMIAVRIVVEMVALKFSPAECMRKPLGIVACGNSKSDANCGERKRGLSGAFWYLLGKQTYPSTTMASFPAFRWSA